MEELQKLYDVLVREGKYTNSFEEFQSKWSQDQSYKTKVYDVMSRDGFYTKDKDSFLQKYSGNATQEPQAQVVPVKKKDIGVSSTPTPQQGTTELPSADGSLATQQPTKKTTPKKEEESYLGNLGTSIMSGINDVNKMIASIPETIYNVFSIPQNAIAYTTGLDISTNADKFKNKVGIKNPVLDYYKEEGKKLEKEISSFNQDRYKTSSIYENVKDGNYQDAFELLGTGIARSAPTSIAMMAGGATLSTAELATASTAAFYDQNLEQIQEENPNNSDIENNIKALGMAAAESVFSSIGEGQIGAVYRDIIRKEGAEVGKQVFKDGLVQMYKGALEKYGVPVGLLGEGIEESATQITQNMISGKPAFDGAADAFILGGGSGVMFTAPISLKNAKDRIKNKIVEVEDKKKINTILEGTEETFSKVFDVSKDSEINEKQLSIASLEKSRDLLVKDLDSDVKKGNITKDQAKQSLYVFDKTKQITGQLRDVDVDEKSKVEIANLLKERENLSEKINDKDDALSVLEKQRISEINEKIKQTILKSKENAVQEPTTDESVLRTEQPQLELQEVGEGNAQPKGVTTEESIITEKPEEVVAEEPTIKDSQIPLKRETFESETDEGNPLTVEVTTNKDGSRKIVTKVDGEVTGGEIISKDNTLPTNEYISGAYGEIKGEPVVEEGIDIMAPAMKEKLTSEQKTELGIEEVTPTEVAPAEDTFFEPMSEEDLKGYEEAVKQGDIDESLISELDKESMEEAYRQRDAEIELAKTTTPGFGDKLMFLHENLGRIRPSDFDSYGDPNQRKGNKGFAIKYLSEKATPLDGILVELSDLFGSEITPDDAIEYILDRESNPEKYKRSKEKIRKLNNAAKIMFSPEKAYEVYMSLRNDAKSMAALDALAGKVLSDEQVKIIKNHLKQKYGETNATTNRGVQRANETSKGIEADNAIKTLQESKEYAEADDIQKENLVRATRKKFGLKEKAAPSVNRLFGKLKDIAKVTMTEKAALVKQIKDTAKGARESVKAFKLASQQLTKDIKELKESGKITATQLTSILVRFSKVNVLNEASVSNFVDYMTKVFADADYANKIETAKINLKTAKKNIVTKLGIADGLIFDLQRLFSINPTMIPDAYLGKYLSLVDIFGKKQAVLTLEEKSQTIKDVQEILDEINNERSLVDELADRFNNSNNKVFKDEKLDYSATLNKMLEEGEIDDNDKQLMSKYKKDIVPKVEKSKLTEEEIQEEKDELTKIIQKLKIDGTELSTKDERKKSKELDSLIKGKAINELTNVELKNLLKVIDNINNGYFPHYAQLMIEKLNEINNSNPLEGAINKSKPLPISKLYAKAKSILTKKDAMLEMIRRNPLFNIDQVLGDFKTKDIFNSLFNKAAEAEAKFTSELKNVQSLLEKAEEKVAKSFKLNANKTLMSKFKMMTYMLQLEYNSNPNNKQVNPAAEYLKATIKHIEAGKSQFGERDAEMLQEIYDKYGKVVGKDANGNDIIDIDNEKLFNSFNDAEKEAIKTVRGINDSKKEKAEYTAAIIRGQKINPLNNYVHLNVLHEYKPNDLSSGESFANDYNNSMRPSTKAKSLIERTGKVSPLNFDIFTSAQRGAKFVLMDYHLTEPIRTARKTMNRTIANMEGKGKVPKEKRQIINAVNNAFEEAIDNLITNNYVETSFGDDVANYVSKQGYRAVLAGTGRFASEFLSNVGFVLLSDPTAFTEGIKNTGLILSSDAPIIMNNLNSKETNRIFPTDTLSGRMIDTGILNQAGGIKGGKSKNVVANKIQQIFNLSGKKYINSIELLSDILISTPDKAIMRPIWFGSFAYNFKKLTGEDVDFKKIAANDEAYMDENKEALEKAKTIADERSVITGASSNAFTGILKGTSKPNQSITTKAFNNFNSFMTKFLVYEFVTARTGIMAAMGNGSLTRKQGVALLGATVTRMTVYSLLIKALGSGLIGLLFDEEDDEEEKAPEKAVGQALASTFSSMLLGRDFGNITKTAINYGVEQVNENYLDFLREGDYDPYKDALQYSVIAPEKKGTQTGVYDFFKNMTGSYGPAIKTADLVLKKAFGEEKQDAEAIERQEKEKNVRIPLEVLGNLGLVPLYKEIRKSVMKDIYKGLENASDVQQGKEYKKYYENKKKIDIIDEIVQKTTDQELINAAEKKVTEIKYSIDKDYAKYLKDLNTIENYKKDKLLVDPETGKKYQNVTDLEKYNPNLWNQNFGPNSEWYKEHKSEKELDKLIDEELTKIKDEENNYSSAPKKAKKRRSKNSDGTYKKKYTRTVTDKEGNVINSYTRTSSLKEI